MPSQPALSIHLAVCQFLTILSPIRAGGGTLRVIACIEDPPLIAKILGQVRSHEAVPDEHKEAVFRPFYRLEIERSERTGGSGLGLAIARQLAIKNGWTIDLMPRQGGGTVAKLELTGADFGECSGPN